MPEGATVVFSAHGVSPVVHAAGRRARPEDDRRHLPAGDQGAPRGEAVRRRRLRHPADRPRGPRGGRGHGRRGARPHPARAEPRRRRRASRSATPRRSPGCSQTTLSVDETMETVGRDPRAVPRAARPAERRHLLRHPEPPARGQGDRPRRRPGDRGRLAATPPTRCAWSRSRSRPAPGRRTASTTPARSTRPGSRASTRSASRPARQRARGAGRGRADVPRRARLPRRPGRAHRRGVADLRAAAGAAPRPEGRRARRAERS